MYNILRNDGNTLTAIPVVGRPIEDPGTFPRCKTWVRNKILKK